jgi:hypothetical protein
MLELWREGMCEEMSKKDKRPVFANATKIRNLLIGADPSARDGLREFSRNRMAAALEELNLRTRSNGNSIEYLIFAPPGFDVEPYLTSKERKSLQAASKGGNGQQI